MLRNRFAAIVLAGGSALAFGQPLEFLVYYDDCNRPLTTLCGGEIAIPDDAAAVELMWDQNNNGPDSTDQPARESENGPPYTIPMNGEEIFGCAGTFFSESTFSPWPSQPNPSRYWLRVYLSEGPTTWRTESFTILEGYYDLALLYGDWLCNDSAVGCPRPPIVPGFIVREDGCNEYAIEWLPYPGQADVDSLILQHDDQQIARLPRTATSYSDTTLPPGREAYSIAARRICALTQDTVLSRTAVSEGAQYVRPPRVTNVAATDGMPLSVTITWNPVTNATSYRVYRDSVWIGTSGALTYMDETASPGVIHWYSVTAYNSNNPDNCAEGEHSALESGHIAAADVPAGRTGIPDAVTLLQNYPNPFNAFTTIEFGVPSPMLARVDLFDVQGRLVRTLFDDVARGNTTLRVDLHDLASGVYVYRLTTPERAQSQKMLFMK